jgi:hypothetical protein
MISITIGTNTSRKRVVVDPNTTLREILQANEVNTGVGTITMDGIPLSASDLGKTLTELNVTENAFIISVAKADNA